MTWKDRGFRQWGQVVEMRGQEQLVRQALQEEGQAQGWEDEDQKAVGRS